jgi:hypothetical protein
MPADVEKPAFRASLRTDLLLVVDGVEAFVLDKGTARQAFAEVRVTDMTRLVVDERVSHLPQIIS